MATDEEMRAFVVKAAELFDEAEVRASHAYNAVLALAPLMKEGRGLGLAGYLQSSRMKNDLRFSAGKIADALAVVFAIHMEGTELAKDKGVDLPQPRDGGGHR